MIENSEIIKATKELTMMIEQHPITKSYILSNKKLAEDNDAAKLWNASLLLVKSYKLKLTTMR